MQGRFPQGVVLIRLETDHELPVDPGLPTIDGGFRNALATYANGKAQLRSCPPAVVLASGPPFHNFVAAVLLARYFNAKLVLEYRDEWSQCPFPWVDKHPDNRGWEAWCLAKADLVIFTTEAQLRHQVSRFRELADERCTVIPNGWDNGDFPDCGSTHGGTEARDGESFDLGFFGNMGAVGEPLEFLDSLAAVLDHDPSLRATLRLHVVGQKTPSALAQLDGFRHRGVVRIVDQIPKDEACREMQFSSALLLLNPPSLARYVPGKLCEYIAARRPVLVYGEGGEVGAIVGRLGVGVVVPSGNKDALREALHRLRRGRFEPDKNLDDWLRSHTREALALRTTQALERLLAT